MAHMWSHCLLFSDAQTTVFVHQNFGIEVADQLGETSRAFQAANERRFDRLTVPQPSFDFS